MSYEKVFVEVVVKFFQDGGMRPLEIRWIDGERYLIDRVKYVERAPSRAGSLIAKRYTVIINGLERYLYYQEDNEKWFVEKRL